MNLTRLAQLFMIALVSFSLGISLAGCKRKRCPLVPKSQAPLRASCKTEANSDSWIRVAGHSLPGKIVYASWYEVPLLSLAYRRAGPSEYTAAHNRLPLGTKVRITHLGNGKSVVVRITDRGITNRRVKIDLCKGAAQELGMISEGIARVRMEVMPANAPVLASQL